MATYPKHFGKTIKTCLCIIQSCQDQTPVYPLAHLPHASLHCTLWSKLPLLSSDNATATGPHVNTVNTRSATLESYLTIHAFSLSPLDSLIIYKNFVSWRFKFFWISLAANFSILFYPFPFPKKVSFFLFLYYLFPVLIQEPKKKKNTNFEGFIQEKYFLAQEKEMEKREIIEEFSWWFSPQVHNSFVGFVLCVKRSKGSLTFDTINKEMIENQFWLRNWVNMSLLFISAFWVSFLVGAWLGFVLGEYFCVLFFFLLLLLFTWLFLCFLLKDTIFIWAALLVLFVLLFIIPLLLYHSHYFFYYSIIFCIIFITLVICIFYIFYYTC